MRDLSKIEFSGEFSKLIKRLFISSNFENNKENLVKEGHYWISENDKHYSTLGSIASYKMSFIKNESTLLSVYVSNKNK